MDGYVVKIALIYTKFKLIYQFKSNEQHNKKNSMHQNDQQYSVVLKWENNKNNYKKFISYLYR